MSVSEFEGNPILKIEKEGLTAMANAAFRDVSFMLRRSHNEQVAKISVSYTHLVCIAAWGQCVLHFLLIPEMMTVVIRQFVFLRI